MVCNIIAECRCYEHAGKGNPMTNQFCASRKGAGLSKCPVDCFAGGCPGQVKGIGPRQPFRIIKEPEPIKEKTDEINELDIIPIALVTLVVLFLVYAT